MNRSSVFFDKTLYASPYMVVTDQEYTKHYYIEGERVCTKIGGGFWGTAPMMPNENALQFMQGDEHGVSGLISEMVGRNIHCAEYYGGWDINPMFAHLSNKANMAEYNQYFYHSDHLGSASFITDATGYVDQHIQYLPFGELFISQRNSTFDSRYKFTAKELDNETNYTYFGARYYDSDLSIWLSVDPLADKYPSLSPYNYCANNPIKYVDPDGMRIDNPLQNMSIRRNRASNLGPGNVRNGGTRPHAGHDLFATPGTNVMAIGAAKVIKTGSSSTYGNYITLEHTKVHYREEMCSETGNNKKVMSHKEIRYSFYAHLESINVKEGDVVLEGAVIGKSGTTGNADAPNGIDDHLHFEYGTKLRPGKFLSKEGLLSPNEAYNGVSFRSANPNANQSNTGVIVTYGQGDNKVEYYMPTNSNKMIRINIPKEDKNDY